MTEVPVQLEGLFFNPGDEPPSVEERAYWCDPENPANPFSGFVGNEAAVRRLSRAAFQAFARCNRECGDQAFALIGPASTGKATLATMFGELLRLPFVKIDSHLCNGLNDIAVKVAKVLENISLPDTGSTLELVDLGDGRIVIPPCIVFLNEVQHLPTKVLPGLRQAVGGNFESKGWNFDSSAICWLIASEEYLLPDAFDRFAQLHFKPLSVEEIAQVMAIHHPDLPADVCRLVARYGSSPRQALEFADEMKIESLMHGRDWPEAAAAVARDWGVERPMLLVNRIGRNGRH